MARRAGDIDVEAVRREFERLDLGDKRLERRALEIVPALAASPGDSFPEQMDSTAAREALYRFLSNPNVTMQALLAGHVRATLARIEGHAVVRVLHDTSPFRFAGEREGLGVIRGDVKGFLAHAALAVTVDEAREPLGILAVNPYVRTADAKRLGLTRGEQQRASLAKPRAEKETSRWERQATSVSKSMPEGTRAIHIMDQEADSYDLIGEMQRAQLDFVIRADPRRKTRDEGCAHDVLARQPASLFRSVHVNRRAKSRFNTPTHPERAERGAGLEVRWGSISLPRQHYSQYEGPEIVVTAVNVVEPNPPAGEQAIEWMLFTSERVETLADATAIVDHYRARWMIEEYFKALKTGCKLESRQLTTFDGLTRALALFVPIAWHLLLLRHLSREEQPRPATAIFDEEQLALLRALLEKRRLTMPASPTVRDAMFGIAALGGHIKNNGDPGWLVLGRGYTRFADAEVGWRIARERSDQS
jgi:hypothetical protein